MTARIDVNADLGEGFARYRFGNDAEMMRFVSSASVACGWHAGDPSIMRHSVEIAVESGVAVGAHVSFPDMLGFGTHRMVARPDEIRDWTLYQVGALKAFTDAAGVELQHVKPHGALYYQCAEDDAVVAAVVEATKALGEGVLFVSMGRPAAEACRRLGVPFVSEGFADMTYEAPERLTPSGFDADDPEVVAERAVRFAVERAGVTVDGTRFEADVDTICVHGHLAGGAQNARRVSERLAEAGVEVVPMRELIGSPQDERGSDAAGARDRR
jgi:UPF0271 protein